MADKKPSAWQEIIKPCVVLTAICVIIVAVLAFVNTQTAPIIDANAKAAASESRKVVVPEADSFDEVQVDEKTVSDYSVVDVYKAQNDAGYAVTVTEKGYNGAIKVMVGFTNEGKIINVSIIEQEETPGLGAKIIEPDFKDQFNGKTGGELSVVKGSASSENEIVAVAGATISSRAATKAINNASLALAAVTGGAK